MGIQRVRRIRADSKHCNVEHALAVEWGADVNRLVIVSTVARFTPSGAGWNVVLTSRLIESPLREVPMPIRIIYERVNHAVHGRSVSEAMLILSGLMLVVSARTNGANEDDPK